MVSGPRAPTMRAQSNNTGNRKLKQRRPLRLPSPRAVGRWLWRALARSAPTLLTVVGVGAVTISGWLGWRWLHHSPRFRVRAIEIAGNDHVSRDQILRRAHL